MGILGLGKDAAVKLNQAEFTVKSVGKEAGSVRDSIEAGRTETWLINVMPDGSSNIKVLDQAGKPKNIDTSKIIIPNKSYNGAVQWYELHLVIKILEWTSSILQWKNTERIQYY